LCPLDAFKRFWSNHRGERRLRKLEAIVFQCREGNAGKTESDNGGPNDSARHQAESVADDQRSQNNLAQGKAARFNREVHEVRKHLPGGDGSVEVEKGQIHWVSRK
jgi:hypothetical protein